ncbi:unnamed protein product [Dovyalis caffra]|uniref:Uncharacterized protein n=1 Tax=Dovyalis caffra TaxID=77055 RepID=A0AAV1S5R1_9ROSI|nr:unnamed protein product [Dovyalis caffra]
MATKIARQLFNALVVKISTDQVGPTSEQSKGKQRFLFLGMDSKTNKELPVTDPLKSEEKDKNGSAMTKQGAYAAISYMASAGFSEVKSSIVMGLRKSVREFDGVSMKETHASASIPSVLRIISFTTSEPQNMSKNPAKLVPFKTLLHTLPLALSYLLYMLVTMESVRAINVPMYTTLRRTTVAFTMIVEYLLTGRKHSLRVVGSAASEMDLDFISVGIILLGAFVAGARDLSFDAYGYAVVFVANICTAIYLASIARIGNKMRSFSYAIDCYEVSKLCLIYDAISILSGKSSNLNSFGLMWCNGIICGPILLFWTSIRGDLEAMRNFPFLLDPGFQSNGYDDPSISYSYLTVISKTAALKCFAGGDASFLIFSPLDLAGYYLVGFHLICLRVAHILMLTGIMLSFQLNVVGQSLGFFGSCLCKNVSFPQEKEERAVLMIHYLLFDLLKSKMLASSVHLLSILGGSRRGVCFCLHVWTEKSESCSRKREKVTTRVRGGMCVSCPHKLTSEFGLIAIHD